MKPNGAPEYFKDTFNAQYFIDYRARMRNRATSDQQAKVIDEWLEKLWREYSRPDKETFCFIIMDDVREALEEKGFHVKVNVAAAETTISLTGEL